MNQTATHAPRRPEPAGLPVVTAEQLVEATSKDSPRYAAGFRAGQRWARKAATFADLDALAQDGRCLFAFLPSWTRGFMDGALAVSAEMGGGTFSPAA